MVTAPFSGFQKETIKFYSELAANNNKTWFDANKPVYENHVLAPARDFVVTLGEALMALSPYVVADPRVNKSIFRIYRDVRFSKDKTPYKTNLALWFPTELKGGKFEKPGYYFHVDSEKLMLGVGIHTFTKPLLKAYRNAVVDPKLGQELAGIVSMLGDKGYNMGTKTYKRVPRGYDPEHQYKELLLFSGLTAGKEFKIPAEFYSSKLVDFCLGYYKDLAPVVSWVSDMKEIAGL